MCEAESNADCTKTGTVSGSAEVELSPGVARKVFGRGGAAPRQGLAAEVDEPMSAGPSSQARGSARLRELGFTDRAAVELVAEQLSPDDPHRVQGMRKTADALDRVRDSIVATYQWTSDLSAEDLSELMTAETWMTAAEADELGLKLDSDGRKAKGGTP